MSTLDSIDCWFKAAKPEPTLRNLGTQFGCNLEEVGEGIKEEDRATTAELVSSLGRLYKSGVFLPFETWKPLSREEQIQKMEAFIDSLGDQIVTAIGVLRFLGADPDDVLSRINESNWSKFDEEGCPILDENGKIIKGPDFVPPSHREAAEKAVDRWLPQTAAKLGDGV